MQLVERRDLAELELLRLVLPAERFGERDGLGRVTGATIGQHPDDGRPAVGGAATAANFERLDVALTDDLSAVANPIEFVQPGKKEQPWQVDGITGATISSTAIANILNASTSYWIPRIRRGLDDFAVSGGEAG